MRLKFNDGAYGGSQKAWDEIREKVLVRANNCCEQCGIPRWAVGYRDDKKVFHAVHSNQTREIARLFKEAQQNADMWNYYDEESEKPPFKYFVIRLTVAHLDHNDKNNDLDNLRAWCERCHLIHDLPQHVENSSKTRELNKQAQDKKNGVLKFDFYE